MVAPGDKRPIGPRGFAAVALAAAAFVAYVGWLLLQPAGLGSLGPEREAPNLWPPVLAGAVVAVLLYVALVAWGAARGTGGGPLAQAGARQGGATRWWAGAGGSRPWLGGVDFLIVGLALAFGLGLQYAFSYGIASDGAIFFAHLRSLVFDLDLRIGPEVEILQLPPRPHHVVPVGSAAVYAPAYLLVAAVDAIGQMLGLWQGPADPAWAGMTDAYRRAADVSSYLAAAVGLLFMHGLLRERFGRGVALLATVGLLGATPLTWYMIFEPSMSHAASFGVVATFLVAWDRWLRGQPRPTRSTHPPRSRSPARRQALIAGALLGLAVIIRPQNAVFGLFVPLGWWLARKAEGTPQSAEAPARLAHAAEADRGKEGSPASSGRERAAAGRGGLDDRARALGWIAAGAAPFLLIQVVMWALIVPLYPFSLVSGEGRYLDLLAPNVLDVLFSSWHGLFSWTPVVYVAAIGMLLLLRRDRQWMVAGLAVFAIMCWVNGSAGDWSGGDAYGGRRFVGALAALAPGLAAAIDGVRRRPLPVLGAIAALAIGWNAILMSQFHRGRIPRDGPIRFDDTVERQVRIYFDEFHFWPFAFPANAWFAWTQGMPLERYDILGPQPWLPAWESDFGNRVGAYLLTGFGPPGTDAFGVNRWFEGRAELVVPLAPAAGAPVDVEIRAKAVGDDPAVRALVELEVGGERVGRAVIGHVAETVRIETSADPWRRGYNRVVLHNLGVLRVPGGRPSAETEGAGRAAAGAGQAGAAGEVGEPAVGETPASQAPSRVPVAVYFVRVASRVPD